MLFRSHEAHVLIPHGVAHAGGIFVHKGVHPLRAEDILGHIHQPGILFEKIKKMSTTELISFAMNYIGLVETNLSLSDMIALAPSVLLLKDAEIKQMQVPVRGTYSSQRISGMAVMVPDRQANIRALKEFFAD